MELLLISLLLLLLTTATSLHASSSPPPTKSELLLASCLTSSNLTNFTFPVSSSRPSDYPPMFEHLLNFSIHNLRFALSKPIALILPTTKEELRSAVLCSRFASVAIRVRSGGHSYEGLSYHVAEPNTSYLVIDLMNLNSVRIDPVARTAWVESGATLGEIYYAISESSDVLGFPAGSCSTVGCGGHFGGGGFGFLSRKYGLAADNVVDAVMVDSSGRILDRKLMGEDVFWAIRGGGGGSWGAIYAWKIRLVTVPRRVTVCGITRTGTSMHVAELVHKWQLVAPILSDEFYLSVYISGTEVKRNQKGISASFSSLYLGPKQRTVTILKQQFTELGVLESDCHEMSWIDSVVHYAGINSRRDLKDRMDHYKGFFKAKSDYVVNKISKLDLKSVLDYLEQEFKAYIIMDPYGGVMARIGSEDLPFPHRRGNLYGIQYMITWGEADDWNRKGYMEWLRGFYDHMTPFVSKNPRAAYVNYLDLDLGTMTSMDKGLAVAKARVWGEKYFLGNYDRLVRAKTVVDPENIFWNAQSIPPLDNTNG